MSEGSDLLSERIEDCIRCGDRSRVNELSDSLALALLADPDSESLQTLNFRWQTHLNKQYVRDHHLDQFLESLMQHLLSNKSDCPIEELLLALDNELAASPKT